jgi:hypothetical protein
LLRRHPAHPFYTPVMLEYRWIFGKGFQKIPWSPKAELSDQKAPLLDSKDECGGTV